MLFFQDASEDLLEENLTLAPKVVQKHRETYFRSKQADPFKISAQRMTYSILLSSDAVEDLLEKNLNLAPEVVRKRRETHVCFKKGDPFEDYRRVNNIYYLAFLPGRC